MTEARRLEISQHNIRNILCATIVEILNTYAFMNFMQCTDFYLSFELLSTSSYTPFTYDKKHVLHLVLNEFFSFPL